MYAFKNLIDVLIYYNNHNHYNHIWYIILLLKNKKIRVVCQALVESGTYERGEG